VLEVRREGFSALLTGDLEEAGEQQIFREVKKVNCLKAGHHGSSTSTTPALLELTSPALALISCGKGNSYGHPHRETLERLQKAGCDIYRTDRFGAVTVTVKDEKRYTAEVWRKEEAYPAGAGWPK
jgi:competence protein ComEC